MPERTPGRTVADAGEHALIDLIRTRVPPPPASVAVGIGDDAAVVEPERNSLDVLTTDALVEGVHFDPAFGGWEDVGFKALAVNLSDLAAMGAAPRVALLSIALPPEMLVVHLEALVDGLLELADRWSVALVGGNITRSPGPLVVNVTATGSVRRRRILMRRGARPGDELFVSGSLGAARAGFEMLRDGVADAAADPQLSDCIRRYLRPEPRVRLGLLLGRLRAASACVDLSDGLADGVRQIASASGVGALLEGDSLPIAPGAKRWFESRGVDPREAALAGGEDYELLVTVPRRRRGSFREARRLARGVDLTRIGVVTADLLIAVRADDTAHELPGGFQHF